MFKRTETNLPPWADEPLMVAHLLGGANGVSFEENLTDEDIRKRVELAIRYGREIRRQLLDYYNNPKQFEQFDD